MGIKPTQVRLSEDTRERIRELVGDSGMAQFIRDAVERELKRREKAKDREG
jgi:predicted DNA-binding protein